MNALEVTQLQLDAYNAHDPDALFALYIEGATYQSPRFDHPLKGKALADFFKSLFKAFPDLRLEVISRGDAGGWLGSQPIHVTRHPHRSVFYGRQPSYRSNHRLSSR
jgi:hypothetical protein